MKLRIRHTTRYTYTQPLRHAVQVLHLWPVSGPTQTVHEWSLTSPAVLHERLDPLGQRMHHGSFTPQAHLPPVCAVSVVAQGVVQTHSAPPDRPLGLALWLEPQGPGTLHPGVFLRANPVSEPHPRITQWAVQALGLRQPPGPFGAPAAGPGPTPTQPPAAPSTVSVNQVLALAHAVRERVAYRQGQTGVETVALEAFDWGLGVCQDQAHVMLAACRGLGWPARYVSGYFYAANEPELASHAWVDVCVDTAARQWLSVDVTHACPTDERHVRLAAGIDYTACPPVKGQRQGGGEEHLQVQVDIQRLDF